MSMSSCTEKRGYSERKAQLNPMEWAVTQEKQTERPFSNKYNKHWEAGSYNCTICDTELFRSDTKFESKSGWPAFSNVVDAKKIKLSPDLSHVGANLLLLVAKPDLARTSVECASCNAHLGHLFHDGPKPSGLRYCINSSSLNFVPDNMDSESKGSDQIDGKTNSASTTKTTALSNTTKHNVNNSNCGKKVKEEQQEEKSSQKIFVQRNACPTNSNTGCGSSSTSSSNSAKICFFQSPISSVTPSTTSAPTRLITNSCSSGNLGSRTNGGNGNNDNNNSLVRRRISLFSPTHMPTETISVAPRMIILRETSL